MGDRQTAFVMLIWLVATTLFFCLIGFRLWDQGLDWLRHSSEPLVALGTIALSCYFALMFSQSKSDAKEESGKRAYDHQEILGTLRDLHAELTAQLNVVESAVDDLDRQTRV